MKKVTLYTDGACSGNPGVGGFCAVLIYNGVEKVITGGEILTTNNRMELSAVISGLSALKEACHVELFTDSSYIVNAFNKGSVYAWKKRGWRLTSSNNETKNADLFSVLLDLTLKHEVVFNWVKGHAENEYNNRCDELARNEILKLKQQIPD